MEQQVYLVEKTKNFIKNAFIKNPDYSFNDRSVMYNHSVMVQELAIKIASETTCNTTIVAISALLHDIGKTYKAPPEILHKHHQDFNLIVSEDFLKSLHLPNNEYISICENIMYKSNSEELKIIKDADALALCFDKKLYMLWIERALKNGLEKDIERKLNKYENLYFNISKSLGKENIQKMQKDWENYRLKNSRK